MKARRVSVRCETEHWRLSEDDPSGTHMLVPVEVWEMVVQALESIVGDTSPHEIGLRGRYGYPRLIKHANRALAEIGGGDE